MGRGSRRRRGDDELLNEKEMARHVGKAGVLRAIGRRGVLGRRDDAKRFEGGREGEACIVVGRYEGLRLEYTLGSRVGIVMPGARPSVNMERMAVDPDGDVYKIWFPCFIQEAPP